MGTFRQQIATNVLSLTKFPELMARVRENRPGDDVELVRKAYEYSQRVHAGQSRASGEPYLVHPLEVALVLADMKLDSVAIAAGLLHDAVEDTLVTVVDIRKEFGPQVAHIVEGVTNISKIDFATREEQQAENLRKMMLAMVDDIRVVLIKLADRLHNMRTLGSLPPGKQQAIARETLDIYTPIAHRLGIWKIKWEMEDLCLRYIDPEGYREIVERVAKTRQERERNVAGAIERLNGEFKELGINAEIQGRPKHFYSIYTKMKKGRDF
ncbi:MAG: bifunctional (p)ppGpp synthetase/guanosine-3',5'-bis(diphosphate) 3'-pyrophosphohydrolase, partial [Acidobacteriales bacterium]|nr:bifunctional (p)ppGpp synthetase/guanosine-3',5'-bis(diphosphate) 3'-pyrophosphohydrolase [Terriglobales bacterium]